MKMKVIFETKTGTTQYVAELIQQQLQSQYHAVDLHSIRYQGNTPVIAGYDYLLFGAPTYDDGLLEKTMRGFIQEFAPDLSKYKVGVFGLGNRFYPQFCLAADFLEEWVHEQKGSLAVPSLKLDGFPATPNQVKEWASKLQ